jgi:hypothetical protein
MQSWDSVRLRPSRRRGFPRSHGPNRRTVNGTRANAWLTSRRALFGSNSARALAFAPNLTRALTYALMERSLSPVAKPGRDNLGCRSVRHAHPKGVHRSLTGQHRGLTRQSILPLACAQAVDGGPRVEPEVYPAHGGWALLSASRPELLNDWSSWGHHLRACAAPLLSKAVAKLESESLFRLVDIIPMMCYDGSLPICGPPSFGNQSHRIVLWTERTR